MLKQYLENYSFLENVHLMNYFESTKSEQRAELCLCTVQS